MTYEINTSQDESAVFFNKLDIIMEAVNTQLQNL
jgi:hypothetical protein